MNAPTSPADRERYMQLLEVDETPDTPTLVHVDPGEPEGANDEAPLTNRAGEPRLRLVSRR